MKIIDKNGKLFGKVSLLDIVIVAVVVFLLVIFVLGRFGGFKLPIASKKSNIDFTLKIKAYNVEKTLKPPFEEGSLLYSVNGEYIGKVTKVEVKPYTVKEKLADGTYFDYESPTAFDYFLTLEGSGTISEKGIFASGTFGLYPNNSITVTSRRFYGGVVVLSVEKNV